MSHAHRDLPFDMLQSVLRRHANEFQHDIHARGGYATHILGTEYTPSLQHLNIDLKSGSEKSPRSTLMTDIISENGKIARIWSGDVNLDDESYNRVPGHVVQILVPSLAKSSKHSDSAGWRGFEHGERRHFGGKEQELHEFVNQHLHSPASGVVTTYTPHMWNWETKENRPMTTEELQEHMSSNALAEEQHPTHSQDFKRLGDLKGLISVNFQYPKPKHSLSMNPDYTPHMYDPRTEQLFGPDKPYNA